ncbi:hypothetical protein C8A00DRAFT_12006 [Chaetomidium leptoderma]|uniref:Uncharacterized protein n=1 Tax=Chaetomidium leptoderma TaxID=669021 RepID=A0AAN6VSN5_9PEZI|nr:hypothetical protein C8A00DRAFT_12006 [Chaetomidium leptoderma]
MDASSRAPAPPPLKLEPVRALSSPVEGTPRSADSMVYLSDQASDPFSPADYPSRSSTSSTSSPLLWGRKVASGSGFGPATPQSMKTPLAVAAPKNVNANSYCGRHSSEFLFGGKGFGDLWRTVTRK